MFCALVWMTDRAPHRSNELPAGTSRQFFRLVVGPVALWYAVLPAKLRNSDWAVAQPHRSAEP